MTLAKADALHSAGVWTHNRKAEPITRRNCVALINIVTKSSIPAFVAPLSPLQQGSLIPSQQREKQKITSFDQAKSSLSWEYN